MRQLPAGTDAAPTRAAGAVAAVPPRTMPAARRALVAGYLLLALAGAAGTWYFNLQFTAGANGESYWAAWFANSASSSAAVDVIVTAVVACVFYVVEGWRLGWRWAAVLVPLTFMIALAFTFPLFLAVREVLLARRERVPAPDPARVS